MTDSAVMVPDAAGTPDLSWLYADEEPEQDYLEPDVDEDYIEAKKPNANEVADIVDELMAEHGLRIGAGPRDERSL